MNRRLFTIINAAIALITVSAVIFDVTRTRTPAGRSRPPRQPANSKSASNQSSEQREPNHIASVEDLADARVDDLGAVSAAHLTDLMRHMTPEQLTDMALKFNDAPIDARTFGGMGVFFQAWSELDPQSALAGAFRMDDIGMRKIAARSVVGSISPSAAPQLITHLAQNPDKDLEDECKNEFLGNLITSWSRLDPDAASRFVDELHVTDHDLNSELSYQTKGDVAYNWGTLDPTAALQWATKQKETSDSSTLFADVIRGWCRNDIAAASAYVAQHATEEDIAGTSSTVVNMMFESNAEEAAQWVSRLPAGSARNDAESTMARNWATKDPASAAKWIATLPTDEQAGLARTVANYWVNDNWEDASRWIATLTGDARDEALSVAANRDAAGYLESVTTALSIANEEKRNTLIENTVRNWASGNADEAQGWVKDSPLSNEQRDHLRSVIAETQKDGAEAGGKAEVERVVIDGH